MKAALSFHPIAGDYDFIGEFREGRALVRNNIAEFRVGYIDKEGRVAVPLEYIGRFEREAGHPVFVHFPFFSDGLAVLMRKGRPVRRPSIPPGRHGPCRLYTTP